MSSRVMIRSLERLIERTPRKRWMKRWERELKLLRARVEVVNFDALDRKVAEASAAYKAKLFCSCGGVLSRDEVVVCPSCRGRDLSYKLRHIT